MVDHKRTSHALLKNTGIIALGQISTKFLSFFLMPLYTAILAQEEYGLFDLLSTYSSLILILLGLQIHQALFRFIVSIREDHERIKTVVSTAVLIEVTALGLYAIVFLFVQRFIVLECKWFLLLSVIANSSFQLTTNIVRGLGHNGNYAFASFLSAAITLALNVVGIAVMQLGVVAMLVAAIVGPTLGSMYLILKEKLYCFLSLRAFSKAKLKTILAYSIPLVPNEISWSVIHASDRVVVSNMLSVAANGLIAVASRFSVIYTTVFSFFNTSWTEQVVLHYKEEGGPEYVSMMFGKVVTFFASIAIGIIACMPFVFPWLVNAAYGEAYNLVPLYLIAVFFNAVVGMISAIYLVHNETGKVALSTGCAAGINLLTDVLLINFIGIYAAPVSSILGYLTISAWRVIDVNKRYCRIQITLKNAVVLICLLLIATLAYYSDFVVLQVVALLFVSVGTFIVNKSVLHLLRKDRHMEK